MTWFWGCGFYGVFEIRWGAFDVASQYMSITGGIPRRLFPSDVHLARLVEAEILQPTGDRPAPMLSPVRAGDGHCRESANN